MESYETKLKKSLREIRDNEVFVKSTGRKIGSSMRYDFMICRANDSKPLLWGPFIYDSEEAALYDGQHLAGGIQRPGNLELMAV